MNISDPNITPRVVVLLTVTGLCAGCELLYWWRWLVCVQVVDIMRVNVDRVLERDQKLSELDSRAGKTVPLLFAQFLFSCHFVCSEFIRLRSCSVILFSLFQLPRNLSFFWPGNESPVATYIVAAVFLGDCYQICILLRPSHFTTDRRQTILSTILPWQISS